MCPFQKRLFSIFAQSIAEVVSVWSLNVAQHSTAYEKQWVVLESKIKLILIVLCKSFPEWTWSTFWHLYF